MNWVILQTQFRHCLLCKAFGPRVPYVPVVLASVLPLYFVLFLCKSYFIIGSHVLLSPLLLFLYPNSCPLSRWCHPNISSSVVHFSSCPQSIPTSGSFQMSEFFASGGQSIGVSASTSVLPMNIQDWSPLGWIGWISLQSKGLSRVFSSTTVQKHQFFRIQCSLESNSHIHTWLLERP